MKPIDIIKAAYDKLAEEYDEDPRSALMRGLSGLMQEPEEIPADAGIELTAIVQPGGAFKVHDQFGRPVKGVTSVAVFQDQSGRPVFQVNL